MEIKLRVSDLIERLLWDNYKTFCLADLKTEEIDKIIEADEEFIITEKDAFVIGLLNVIYTQEVVYKYKQYLREIIDNKSFLFEDVEPNKTIKRKYITRKILTTNAKAFLKKIPKNYESNNIVFNKQIKMLNDVNEFFINEVKLLEYQIIHDWPCVKYGQVKKIINRINADDFE